jgi:hypothetical protein
MTKKQKQIRDAIAYRTFRLRAIGLYGGECKCCGERRLEFLSFDHIKGGGTKARKERPDHHSRNLYKSLVTNYDPDFFRILCHNCNSSLGYYGYCPHQIKDKTCQKLKDI